MFVVKSVVIRINGFGYGSINSSPHRIQALSVTGLCITAWSLLRSVKFPKKSVRRLTDFFNVLQFVFKAIFIIPPPQNVGGAILDSLCRVGRSVGQSFGPSVRLQFLSAL